MNQSSYAKIIALDTRRYFKSINTLMGIVSGIVCDDKLENSEFQYLSTWLTENSDLSQEYPASVIYRRVREVLRDGLITEEERIHLLNELKILSGNDFMATGSSLPDHISSVFDADPHVIIPGNVFVFTGEFMWGSRDSLHHAIEHRGGYFKKSVTNSTNYLVVGSKASPDWITENFGRKFQKAVDMAQSGEYEIAIIREADWVIALDK